MQEWLIHSMQECLVVCIYAEVARRLIVCMQEWLIVCIADYEPLLHAIYISHSCMETTSHSCMQYI